MFDDYQVFVNTCPLIDDPALGLPGEVGEVLELIKKDRRAGSRRKVIDLKNLEAELGDVLWYLTKVASQYGLSLSEIVNTNKSKLTKRYEL